MGNETEICRESGPIPAAPGGPGTGKRGGFYRDLKRKNPRKGLNSGPISCYNF